MRASSPVAEPPVPTLQRLLATLSLGVACALAGAAPNAAAPAARAPAARAAVPDGGFRIPGSFEPL